MKKHFVYLPFGLMLLLQSSLAHSANWPSESKLFSDVSRYWKKQWPEQQFAHVTKKSNCENAELEDEAYLKKTGKSRKIKACAVEADVFISQGYRFLIYRGSLVYYLWGKIIGLKPGEEKTAWKEGGVPPPSQEEAVALLEEFAKQKYIASDIEVSVQEIGKPRQFGEFYRISLIVDVAFSKNGTPQKQEKVFASLQSEGGSWQPVTNLTFQ